MIITNVVQNSPQWFAIRAGVITASMFSEVRKTMNGLEDRQRLYVDALLSGMSEKDAREHAGYKAAPQSDRVRRALAGEKVGEYTSAALDYGFRLAIERICGESLDEGGFDTFAARRGRELEPDARAHHEREINAFVQQTGFVKTDCGRFGASADGLIDNDGGSEYKCFIAPERIREIVLEHDISDHYDQIQGGMWITGRDWWDFCLYCPALEPANRELTRFRVYRDEDYIEALEADLVAFDENVVKPYYDKLLAGQVPPRQRDTHDAAEAAELF